MFLKKLNKSVSRFPAIVYLSLLVFLLIINNFGREHTKAIITAPMAYLMKGPSPGADLIDVVTKGHRVDILGQDDIWVKISWNNQTAYIKSNNLMAVKL